MNLYNIRGSENGLKKIFIYIHRRYCNFSNFLENPKGGPFYVKEFFMELDEKSFLDQFLILYIIEVQKLRASCLFNFPRDTVHDAANSIIKSILKSNAQQGHSKTKQTHSKNQSVSRKMQVIGACGA